MSFSSDVKEELAKQFSPSRHCQIAEITAIISMCGRVTISSGDKYGLWISTENIAVARKYFTLLRKTFNINTENSIIQNRNLKKSRTYTVAVIKNEDAVKILKTCKLLNEDNELEESMSLIDNMVLRQTCCKRAFIRGAFLVAGSISNPSKSYHFEIVCTDKKKAKQLQVIIQTFHVEAKIILRKKNYVVYIKEGSQIVELLNIMEAHVALMDMENVRILKDMRNAVNRQVNCETANINKTVNAAVKQIEDIKLIQNQKGFEDLEDGIRDIAKLRLEYPEATLKELGLLLTPNVGKSGVNHRLRKLSSLAEKLRENKEEDYYD
jgi:conserved hypothetical protein